MQLTEAVVAALCCDAANTTPAPNDWAAGVKVGELMELVRYLNRLKEYLESHNHDGLVKDDPEYKKQLDDAYDYLGKTVNELAAGMTDIGAELADR